MAFRRRFIMVYPEFLHNLRREIPNIGTRMELFCMLIALDQNTSQVSDVLNVNANSVKMMRLLSFAKKPLPLLLLRRLQRILAYIIRLVARSF